MRCATTSASDLCPNPPERALAIALSPGKVLARESRLIANHSSQAAKVFALTANTAAIPYEDIAIKNRPKAVFHFQAG